MKSRYYVLIIFLLIAALILGIQVPACALLIEDSYPLMIFAFMSIGGLIFGGVSLLFSRKDKKVNPERKLQKKDAPHIILLSFFLLIAGVLTIMGLEMVASSTESLVKGLTLLITSIIALIILKEKISRHLWITIMLITLGVITISSGSFERMFSSPGIILIFISCIWTGLAYCSQKKLAHRDTGTIITLSAIIPVIGGFIIALFFGEALPDPLSIIIAVILGILVYGLAAFFFMRAAREISVTKCVAIISLAPFISMGISLWIFQEQLTVSFVISLLLLIPGFIITIKDKTDKERIDRIKEREDSSLSSKITNKLPLEFYDVRNYLTSIGLLVLFSYFLLLALSYLDLANTGTTNEIDFIISLIMIIIGIILLILRRRDLIGMIFLMSGCLVGMMLFVGYHPVIILTCGIITLLFGIIILFVKEKLRFVYAPISITSGILLLLVTVTDSNLLLIPYLFIAIYLAIIVFFTTGLRPNFKLTQILCQDDVTSFEVSGSTLCYLIIAASVIPRICQFIFGIDLVPIEIVSYFSILCGIMIGIIALLMVIVGKNRFTSCIFLGVMVFLLLSGLTSGATHYIVGIFMMVLGLICLLRIEKTYMLLSFLCIVYGISSLAAIPIYGAVVLPIGNLIMNIAVFAIAIYLSFAVFSQIKKIPLY